MPNFNGQPFPPAVGDSGDFFYWDANGDNMFTTTPNERYGFNLATGPFYSNLLIKLTGEAGAPASCYANCDDSTGTPLLTGNDFTCFINKFGQNDPYANCDGSTGSPMLTGNDFTCFINKFGLPCP